MLISFSESTTRDISWGGQSEKTAACSCLWQLERDVSPFEKRTCQHYEFTSVRQWWMQAKPFVKTVRDQTTQSSWRVAFVKLNRSPCFVDQDRLPFSNYQRQHRGRVSFAPTLRTNQEQQHSIDWCRSPLFQSVMKPPRADTGLLPKISSSLLPFQMAVIWFQLMVLKP